MTYKHPTRQEALQALERLEDRNALQLADSMKAFTRGDTVYYAEWQAWRRAAWTPEADKLLADFRAAHPE